LPTQRKRAESIQVRERPARRPKGVFVGLAAVDLVYTVDDVPGRNQKLSVEGQQICAGGPATNAAVTFAFLGGRAELVTATGSHPLVSVIREDLRRHSVRLHDLAGDRRETPPLSSIMVVRGTGERSVVSANAAVFSRLRGKFNLQWLRGASILMVDGHYMPVGIAAARAARKDGIPVVMDSGSWKEGMERLLPLVDVAICSDDYRPPGCRDTGAVLDFLRGQGIRRVAITRGASPLRFMDDGKAGKIAIDKIKAVDTLGAGDIFHGAFCYYFSQQDASFRDALSKAARVATFSCRYSGTREWMGKGKGQGLGTRE
jgi:sugar/nucleoside kinase (ribokinase family)